jgi:hypothetical protein
LIAHRMLIAIANQHAGGRGLPKGNFPHEVGI